MHQAFKQKAWRFVFGTRMIEARLTIVRCTLTFKSGLEMFSEHVAMNTCNVASVVSRR